MADTDDANTEEEPSIEEILDSIRQIISDDDEEEAAEAPAEESVEEEEEVVELTDKVEDEPAPEPEPEEEPEPEPTPEPEPEEPEPEPVEIDMQDPEPEAEPATEADDDALFTQIAESATADGFEKLVKKTAVEYNGITLEEIVRTELKPLLREWLDDNLPSMIERLVQEELERISKRVLDD